MGAGGIPSGGIVIVHGRRGDLPIVSSHINSRYDLYVNGVKVQSRWFDANGFAIRNRDFDHQDAHNNHEFPHDHRWYNKGEYIDKHGQARILLIRDEEPDPAGPDYINYPTDEE